MDSEKELAFVLAWALWLVTVLGSLGLAWALSLK
jgi:hypothetical protein